MEIIDPNPYSQNNNTYRYLQPVPNSTAVLVLGILSIVICCGFVGIILGIIALVMANNGEQAYLSNPEVYDIASYKNLKTGKICAIVGISLGALTFIGMIIRLIFIGPFINGFPWHDVFH